MTRRVSDRPPFRLGDTEVAPGRRGSVDLPIASLVTGTPVHVRVHVVHGRQPGPRVWITSAIHGDEIQGVEVIRRTLGGLDPRRIAGTVLLIPVVNVHGYVSGDRYLPDRRDLNRSFPGSPRGSLAARIAHVLMTEVVSGSQLGIDLHTGAVGRTNLAQLRADLSDARTAELADVFGAPIAVDASVRDGSLRQAATEAGCTVLLFEGGEALRYDEPTIAAAHAGVMRVLHAVGTLPEPVADPGDGTVTSLRSGWVRATRSGVVHHHAALGDRVGVGEVVATVYSPHGRRLGGLKTRRAGVVIGSATHPLVNRGDAVVHVAEVEEPS